MKIAYSFQDGQSCEIDVSAEFGELLLELDRQERNNERKETRRHTSLYSFDYEGEIFDSHEDVAGTVERDMELAELRHAVATLSPAQRELLRAVYFEGRSFAEIAHDEGVSKQAINDRKKRILNKLKIAP